MFNAIAALRATAALWVLVAHCMIWGGWYGVPLPSAKFAVDLFMMISGFLMVSQADGRAASEPLIGTRNRWRFWTRRYFRIAPAYYLALGLSVVSAPLLLGGYQALQDLNPGFWKFQQIYKPSAIDYSAENILLHASFLFGMLPEWSATTMLPDWSLGLEMQFYVAFPFLLMVFNRWGLAGVAGMAAAAILASSYVGGFPEQTLLVFKLNQFLAGMLIFRARDFRTCLLVIALAGLDGAVPAALSVIMLVAVHFESIGRLPKMFGGRIVRFGADASYAVYLFHGFFIAVFGLGVSRLPALAQVSAPARVVLMLAFVLIGAYATAWFVFRWVETPGIELGRHVVRRWASGKAALA
jgi:peptidoglycan/LPS O-acetylase OafA/YrhL